MSRRARRVRWRPAADFVSPYLRVGLLNPLRPKSETNELLANKPGEGQADAQGRKQDPENEERFAARKRPDHPVEVHPEKPGHIEAVDIFSPCPLV